MRKAANGIDTILIQDGDIFIYLRHDDDHKMWCHHWRVTNTQRKRFDEEKIGIGEVVQVRLKGKWPL
jgi:hypothetical protein